ncbi:MAG: low-specificity L-threonine aldolase [Deltaproteobacteria bacterium]|nr:MAG: low-specificity L-threonine aldolase [Deltaproteobacteria bacterium]
MIDLRSDTVTRPTPAMRRAVASAEVGDDVYGEDPTVNRLEALAAERLGKERALFLPSGTMGNQVAIRCHTEPGDEVIVEDGAHPFHYEAGGAALISGVLLRRIAGTAGVIDPAALQAEFRDEDVHHAPQRLVCVEDTSNRGGGTVWPLAHLDEVAAVAHRHGAATHMDGARLFNAVVASGIPATRRVRGYDTVTFCLSKGLGAPVGSLLCGPAEVIAKARRVRKALGGGMRQAGLLAAAGIHALEHHVDRLADDHARAAALARGLARRGLEVQPPQTNMVYVTVDDARALVARLRDHGVLCGAVGADRIRLVLHLDIHDEDVDATLAAFDRALES